MTEVAAIGVYNTTETNHFLGLSSRRLDTKTRNSSNWSNLENTSAKYPLHSQSGSLATPTRDLSSSFSGIPSGTDVSNRSSELGPDVCWFLVHDEMDVRYWPSEWKGCQQVEPDILTSTRLPDVEKYNHHGLCHLDNLFR